MSWLITGTQKLDPDAAIYIGRVEAADGQSLEASVQDAINAFVVGCKADGIWSAIKASCILAGARTLNGALVPLVGTAPTNFNFVSGDYNRKTGLKGNGLTKYLNSNRMQNLDPQDSFHISVVRSGAGGGCFIGSLGSPYDLLDAEGSGGIGRVFLRNNSGSTTTLSISGTTGFYGAARSSASTVLARANLTAQTFTNSSSGRGSNPLYVFARAVDPAIASFSPARLSFYSIGESLNLALLDARVTTLMSALAAAIN